MKKILIVVDLQNDFASIGGTLSTPESQDANNKAAEYIRTTDADFIICTKDTHNLGYSETLEGKLLPTQHCLRGTWGWELTDKVQKALDECGKDSAVVIKETFGYLGWKTLLGADVEEDTKFEILGVCTGICVASNASILRATYPNNEITVIPWCCACVTPESHKAALETMSSQQIFIADNP